MARHVEKTRLYIRKFLNLSKHHASALLLLSVEDSTGHDLDDNWTNIHCEIADCNERVFLQFRMADAADRANSVRKAEILAEAFALFAHAVKEEAHVIAKREAAFKKQERAKGKTELEITTTDEPVVAEPQLRRLLRRRR